jgi:hypothetical protein
MRSLGSGREGEKEEIEALSYRRVFSIDEQGRTVIKMPAHVHLALLGPRVNLYCDMARPAARPAVEGTSVDDDKSNNNYGQI